MIFHLYSLHSLLCLLSTESKKFKNSINLRKDITSKHKASMYWLCFTVQTLQEKIMKLNQIKEANIIQAQERQDRIIFFVIQLQPEKVVRSNWKAHAIKVLELQVGFFFNEVQPLPEKYEVHKIQAQAWKEISQVFGHGWLCHPFLPSGRFSENFNLSSGFVIQEVKVQTLINFYDSLYQ